MKEPNTGDEGYRLLASAIIATACNDYANSVWYLKDNRDGRCGVAWKMFYDEWNEVARARVSSSPDYQKKIRKMRSNVLNWQTNIVVSERMEKDVREFLHSDWFDILAIEPMDGDYVLRLLDDRAEKEEYNPLQNYRYINKMKGEMR